MKSSLPKLLFFITICSSAVAQTYKAPTGHEGYYRVDKEIILDSKHKEISTGKWFVHVIKATDTSLQLDCKLLSFKVNIGDRVFNTEDSMNMVPFSNTSDIAICLLNEPFPFLLTRDSIAIQPGALAILTEHIKEWQIQEQEANIIKQQLSLFLWRELSAIFPGKAAPLSAAPGNALTKVTPLKGPSAKYTPLSKDFIEAAIYQSYSSAMLRKGYLYDSVKLEAYFNRFEPLFGDKAFYKVAKLDMLLNSTMADKYERYDALIRHIPDAFIANSQVHLANKMQTTNGFPLDSIYSTLRYLSRIKNGYSDWIQHDFSQYFLHGRDAQGIQLLQKIATDKDVIIRQEAYPLYLWVLAKGTSNKDSLLLLARTLQKMSQGGPGNPHRYALLVYKELMAKGLITEATQLLDNHLAGMEKITLDTTSQDRYLVQNMLAFAYKLKSDLVKNTDAKASLDFLAKAAFYSPKSNLEKAHGSFYDRAFLKSKESYRDEYATVLLKQGNSEQGIGMLVQMINTDPTMLKELQKSYTETYPAEDFYTFLHEQVIKSWKKAPSFTLKNPDNSLTYSLSDYKGRWLLVDFWGTWCGPCRSEIPTINAFVQKNKERAEFSFLSIACKDQPRMVSDYLRNEGFTLPVVMSDNMIEKQYEVTSYPSKYLISPYGTMIPIVHGQDWQKAIELFTGVQPKKS